MQSIDRPFVRLSEIGVVLLFRSRDEFDTLPWFTQQREGSEPGQQAIAARNKTALSQTRDSAPSLGDEDPAHCSAPSDLLLPVARPEFPDGDVVRVSPGRRSSAERASGRLSAGRNGRDANAPPAPEAVDCASGDRDAAPPCSAMTDPAQLSSENANPAAPVSAIGPSWLLRAKVIAPAPPRGYLHRSSLERSISSVLKRRLTVLQAPAGFGKTTVLADIFHRKKMDGVAVGWLSVDEDDRPEVFGDYVARAIQHAGVDLAELNGGDIWSSSHFARQFGMLARAIEAHSGPCLLALDEVERLPPCTVELLDRILTRSPSNLHFALACRVNPGLDLMAHMLEGSAVVIGAEEFRFSRSEIARLYQGELSKRELEAVRERTAGWPVALMIDRNLRARTEEGIGGEGPRFSAEFVGVRLMRGMTPEERAQLFELAVFDWVSADVVDEVLGSSDARLRITSLASLAGLFQASEEDRSVRRLHPLVKEYCVNRLATEDPGRKRLLHSRIAAVLARRGHHRLAWRHATAAEDGRLTGELIERCGVLELWLREGASGLEAADHLLTPEIMARYPRLGLLRCVQLHLAAKFAEATALYDAVDQQTEGFVRDREGGDANLLAADRAFAEAALSGGWRSSRESRFEALLPSEEWPEPASWRERMMMGAHHLLRCIFNCQFANFEKSQHHGRRALALFPDGMPHGKFFASMHLGIAAMAQGQVPEALESYQQARRLARKFFPSDWRLVSSVDVMTMELDLERNRERAIRQRTLKDLPTLRGLWNEGFAAAIGVRAALTFKQYEGGAVIQYLTVTNEAVRGASFRSLSSFLSLLLAFYLAKTGRGDEAARIWSENAQPCESEDLLSVGERSWRRMEALWCARTEILTAQYDFDAAMELADAGNRIATEYGVTRVALRCLGQSMAAACHAGDEDRALARLGDFLRVTKDVDYYRALASQREMSCDLLHKLLAKNDDADLREPAEAALAHLGRWSARTPVFSARELDVLSEVRQGLRNREIATFLGITEEGVRFHLRNIYRKAGASDRMEAVRHAEAEGLLP